MANKYSKLGYGNASDIATAIESGKFFSISTLAERLTAFCIEQLGYLVASETINFLVVKEPNEVVNIRLSALLLSEVFHQRLTSTVRGEASLGSASP